LLTLEVNNGGDSTQNVGCNIVSVCSAFGGKLAVATKEAPELDVVLSNRETTVGLRRLY
jgi:hypothetical protein